MYGSSPYDTHVKWRKKGNSDDVSERCQRRLSRLHGPWPVSSHMNRGLTGRTKGKDVPSGKNSIMKDGRNGNMVDEGK